MNDGRWLLDYFHGKQEDVKFIQAAADRIRDNIKVAGAAIMDTGQALTEVKQRLPHGLWLPWLKAEFGWSARHAQKLMAVYERFKCEDVFAFARIEPSALMLLARETTPETVRKAAIDQAAAGEVVTHKQARAMTKRERDLRATTQRAQTNTPKKAALSNEEFHARTYLHGDEHKDAMAFGFIFVVSRATRAPITRSLDQSTSIWYTNRYRQDLIRTD